jgi:hypothetical protein
MFKRKLNIVLALAVCALLLPMTVSAKKPVERPMHLSGSGIVTWTPEGTWEATESGQATHLGRYSLEESGIWYFTETGYAFEGTGTCTAANDDQFTFEITIIVIVESGEENTHMDIAGGTGRFKDASGSVDFVSETNELTGAYTISGTGTIAY